jgi:hypothetical protein
LKLEYFEDGLDGGPMILLYGGGSEEVSLLRSVIRQLADGVSAQFVLNDLPFVESVGTCQLRAVSSPTDLGVVGRASADFEWTLRTESWLQVDEQLEPFCEEKSGVFFQYLNPSNGPEIIYSTAREW